MLCLFSDLLPVLFCTQVSQSVALAPSPQISLPILALDLLIYRLVAPLLYRFSLLVMKLVAKFVSSLVMMKQRSAPSASTACQCNPETLITYLILNAVYIVVSVPPLIVLWYVLVMQSTPPDHYHYCTLHSDLVYY